MKEGIYLYLILINLTGFAVSAWDKHAAKRKRKRVPERTLWLLAMAGGSVGLYLSMMIYRHKTRHKSFMIGMPLLITVQLVIAVLVRLAK